MGREERTEELKKRVGERLTDDQKENLKGLGSTIEKNKGNFLQTITFQNIAIYGMKELGERLWDEIKKSDITVKYVIERNPSVLGDFVILSPEDELPPVDLIVITADYYYSEISDMLGKKVDYTMLSISSLIGRAYGVWL